MGVCPLTCIKSDDTVQEKLKGIRFFDEAQNTPGLVKRPGAFWIVRVPLQYSS